jgi:hypothetical protein
MSRKKSRFILVVEGCGIVDHELDFSYHCTVSGPDQAEPSVHELYATIGLTSRRVNWIKKSYVSWKIDARLAC